MFIFQKKKNFIKKLEKIENKIIFWSKNNNIFTLFFKKIEHKIERVNYYLYFNSFLFRNDIYSMDDSFSRWNY